MSRGKMLFPFLRSADLILFRFYSKTYQVALSFFSIRLINCLNLFRYNLIFQRLILKDLAFLQILQLKWNISYFHLFSCINRFCLLKNKTNKKKRRWSHFYTSVLKGRLVTFYYHTNTNLSFCKSLFQNMLMIHAMSVSLIKPEKQGFCS